MIQKNCLKISALSLFAMGLLSACSSAQIYLPDQEFNVPEVSGGFGNGAFHLGSMGATRVRLSKDITNPAPFSGGADIGESDIGAYPAVGLVIGLLSPLDAVLDTAGGKLKFQFYGSQKPNDFKGVVSIGGGGDNVNFTAVSGSTGTAAATVKARYYNMSVSGGYRFDTLLVYSSLSVRNVATDTTVTQGSSNFQQSDSGKHVKLGIGGKYNWTKYYVLGEVTLTSTSITRASDYNDGSVGFVVGYDW